MASIDQRNEDKRKPVVRVEVPAITIPNGGTTEVTETPNINMTIKSIVVRAGNATNGITFTLKLKDDNGVEHLSKASIAENANTVLLSTKATADFDEICMNGTVTVGITPSGDPGAGGVDVNVDLYGV
jgi:hypothetical protein